MPDKPRFWPFPWDPPPPLPEVEDTRPQLRPAPPSVRDYVPSIREALSRREGLFRPVVEALHNVVDIKPENFQENPLGNVGDFTASMPPIFSKIKGMFGKAAAKAPEIVSPVKTQIPIPKRMAKPTREDPMKVLGEIKPSGKQDFDKLVSQVSLLRQKAKEQGGLLGADLGRLKRLQNQMMAHEAMPADIGKRLSIRGRVQKTKLPPDTTGGLKPPEPLAGVLPEGPPPPHLVESAGGTPKAPMSAVRAGLLEAAAIPKSIQASGDLSFPLRQGLPFASRKEYWKNMTPMVRSFVNNKFAEESQQELVKRANFPLYKKYKLALTELTVNRAQREEHFQSVLVDKYYPFAKRSANAYMTFGNRLRADVFDDVAEKFGKLGHDINTDEKLGRALAKYVNTMTGRGDFGKYEGAILMLNLGLFSPRLQASRMRMLNPRYYWKLPRPLQKEALRDLGTVTGIIGSLGGLAKATADQTGVDFEFNPLHADFGKLMIGKNTSVDLTGGVGGYIRTIARTVTGKYQTRGRGMQEHSAKVGGRTRQKELQNFAENKLAPVASAINTMLKGQDIEGKPASLKKEILSRTYPIILGDLVELYKEDPKLILPLIGPMMLGAGVQTYPPRYKSGGRGRRRRRRSR